MSEDIRRLYPADPENVPGPFYVVASHCLACEAPLAEAPTLMSGRNNCRFHKQPETEEEITQAINAIKVCCVNCIRYAGSDKTILDHINWPEVCDRLAVTPSDA